MKDFLRIPDEDVVMRGAKAWHGLGSTLEAVAVRISHDIAQARENGDLPACTRTVVTVLPEQRILHIRVEGFAIIPESATSRAVMASLFALASDHNIVPLDPTGRPMFTQHIVLVDPFGQPFATMIGAGIGDTEPVTPSLSVPLLDDHLSDSLLRLPR